MKYLVPLLLVALLAGCQTPAEVKAVAIGTRTESQKFAKAYESDLAATITYVQAYKNMTAKLVAEADQANANSHKLLEAWKDLAARDLKLRVLAMWDARALKLLNEEFPQYVTQEYFARINTRLGPLRAARRANAAAAAAAPANTALAVELLKSEYRVAEYEHQSYAELIKLYDQLHSEIATGRAELLKSIALTEPTATGPAKISLDTRPATVAAVDPTKDDVLKALTARKTEVADTAAAQDEALQAVEFYLKNDGYYRILAKEALTGLATGIVTGGQDALQLSKLPGKVADVAKSLGFTSDQVQAEIKSATEKLTDQAVQKAQAGLQKIFDDGLAKLEEKANSALTKVKSSAANALTKLENTPNP